MSRLTAVKTALRTVNGAIRDRAQHEVERLYRESLVRRVLGFSSGWFRTTFDDRVEPLRHIPLGMFLYNLRAVVLAFAGAFLGLLLLPVALTRFDDALAVWLFLSSVWFVGLVVTLGLHPSFIRRLTRNPFHSQKNVLPALFHLYFVLDFSLIFLMIIVGHAAFGLQVETYVFLLLSNLVVYVAFKGRRANSIAISVAMVAILVLIVAVSGRGPAEMAAPAEPRWFYVAMFVGPTFGSFALTVLTIAMIVMLRLRAVGGATDRFEDLNEFSRELLTRDDQDNGEATSLDQRLLRVLRLLCDDRPDYWFDSACVYFAEEHQDRGRLLVPGPKVRFPEADGNRGGIVPAGLLRDIRRPLVIPLVNQFYLTPDDPLLKARSDLEAPAAVVPVESRGRTIAILALFGRPGGPPADDNDDSFLASLAYVVGEAMAIDQLANRSSALREMDELFEERTLEEIFEHAARIMRAHLNTQACMVLYRPNDSETDLRIEARIGLSDQVLGNRYEVGVGKTGRVALEGESLRVDDVAGHSQEFEGHLLSNLEGALGGPISSWLCVPIGDRDGNRGLIKVLNSTNRCAWFTDRDEELARALARRLRVVVDKFTHLEEALRERSAAQQAARDREYDIVTIAHQLLGPLTVLSGSLEEVRANAPEKLAEQIEAAEDLAEGAMMLAHGTAVSLGSNLEAVSIPDPADSTEIDKHSALETYRSDLEKTVSRNCRTSRREDLTFVLDVDGSRPQPCVPQDTFNAVMQVLVENALSYADLDTAVEIGHCYRESVGRDCLTVSSIGLPILPEEKDAIFDRFRRSKSVKGTGQYTPGVGLGLWTARQMMLMAGGDLAVELDPLSPRHTTFVVVLPRQSE